MHLVSKGMYNAEHSPKEDIIIKPYDASLFTASCYYFRLGGLRQGGKPVPMKEPLKLRKHETQLVFSMETFSLTSRVLAFIGPCSELLLRGILLHNSPTIDPGFSGSLEMLLENRSDETIALHVGTKIGKAVFFDISDGLLDLDAYMQTQTQMAAWKERAEAGRLIQGWIEKKIDTEGPK